MGLHPEPGLRALSILAGGVGFSAHAWFHLDTLAASWNLRSTLDVRPLAITIRAPIDNIEN